VDQRGKQLAKNTLTTQHDTQPAPRETAGTLTEQLAYTGAQNGESIVLNTSQCGVTIHSRSGEVVNPCKLSVPKIATLIQGFDARLAKRPFLVFDFRAIWRSAWHRIS